MGLQPDGRIVVVGTAVSAGVKVQQYERVTRSGQLEGFLLAQSPGDCAEVTVQPWDRLSLQAALGLAAQLPQRSGATSQVHETPWNARQPRIGCTSLHGANERKIRRRYRSTFPAFHRTPWPH